MLSGRGLCDELITRPEESYRLRCVVVCDLETSRMGGLYIYDISNLRVKGGDPVRTKIVIDNKIIIIFYSFFAVALRPNPGHGLLILDVSR